MASLDNFEVVELRSGAEQPALLAAANTINRAFSDDPFIAWLRPNAKPWGDLDPKSTKWQIRRVERTLRRGRIFVVREKNPKAGESRTVFPAVAFLIPPPDGNWSSRLWRALEYLRQWIEDIFDPVPDDSCPKRIRTMFQVHHETQTRLEQQESHPLHYVEVVAVDPSFQGRGMGSMIFRHVLEQSRLATAIYLESSKESNVRFYEKFGFSQEGILPLRDETGDKTVAETYLWLMVKRQCRVD